MRETSAPPPKTSKKPHSPSSATSPAGEAARRQLGRDDAVFGGAAGVQRLGHRSEVDADTGAHAGGDAERVRQLSAVEAQQLRGARRGAERADRAGGVEAAQVVIRVDRLGDLALDFEAGEERFEEDAARRAEPLRRARATRRARARSGASAARTCDRASSRAACRRSPSRGRSRRWRARPAPRWRPSARGREASRRRVRPMPSRARERSRCL